MDIIIKSQRNHQTWPSFHLVYEWEDIIQSYLPKCEIRLENKIYYYINKIAAKCNVCPNFFRKKEKYTLYFEMTAKTKSNLYNRVEIIPIIIDYFLDDSQINNFIKAYKNNPLVLITSKEVYDHLKSLKTKLNVKHFPLSISDKYKLSSNSQFEKKYDLVLMGRQNPVLEGFLNTYAKNHPDFVYVFRKVVDSDFLYFTSDGKELGPINSREDYINLMKQSKCGLYATPGIDGGEKRTNGFNQVTPRFLELIACGCHVIARYPQNSDTDFYNIQKFSKSIDSYEAFEQAMDFARTHDVNMQEYAKYLANHYTSTRAILLSELINNL